MPNLRGRGGDGRSVTARIGAPSATLVVRRGQAHGVPRDFWLGAAVPREKAIATDALHGTFEYRMTPEESAHLEATFGDEAADAGFPGDATTVLRFVDGLWQLSFLVVNDDLAYRWSIDGDVLSLTLLDAPPGAEQVRFVTERAFTRTGS